MLSRKKDTNWTEERVLNLQIQRNFLMVANVIAIFVLFVSLLMIKQLYADREIKPYIIEYDKKSGMLSMVDSSTKKEYTSQEAVKESLFVDYLKQREGLESYSIEAHINKVRIMSSKEIYKSFIENATQDISILQSSGRNSKYDIDITSITYLSPNKVEIKFKKKLIAGDRIISTRYFKVLLVFDFFDLEATVDDLRLNPLGFQITYYRLLEEKILDQNQANGQINNVQSQGAANVVYDNAG